MHAGLYGKYQLTLPFTSLLRKEKYELMFPTTPFRGLSLVRIDLADSLMGCQPIPVNSHASLSHAAN